MSTLKLSPWRLLMFAPTVSQMIKKQAERDGMSVLVEACCKVKSRSPERRQEVLSELEKNFCVLLYQIRTPSKRLPLP